MSNTFAIVFIRHIKQTNKIIQSRLTILESSNNPIISKAKEEATLAASSKLPISWKLASISLEKS